MTTDRELMQMALEALESVFEGDDKGAEYWTVTGGTYEAVECMNAMRALRARLAQPEERDRSAAKFIKPRPGWRGLTTQDKCEIINQTEPNDRGYVMALVEAKLKGKNIG